MRLMHAYFVPKEKTCIGYLKGRGFGCQAAYLILSKLNMKFAMIALPAQQTLPQECKSTNGRMSQKMDNLSYWQYKWKVNIRWHVTYSYLLEATGSIITAIVVKHVPQVSENDSYILAASFYFIFCSPAIYFVLIIYEVLVTMIACVYYWLFWTLCTLSAHILLSCRFSCTQQLLDTS